MAEYNDVIKQFKRMCRYYNGQKCGGCPLYCKGHGCNISRCRTLAFDDKEFANVVMSWVAEHPEPIYETWYDYLHSIGVLHKKHTAAGDVTEIHWGNMMTPIPADIAEKLGLQPKEVQHGH